MVSGQKKVPKTSSLKSCLLSGIGRCSSPSARRPLSFRLRTLHTNLQLWYFTHFVSKCLLQAETSRTIRLTHPVYNSSFRGQKWMRQRMNPQWNFAKGLWLGKDCRAEVLLQSSIEGSSFAAVIVVQDNNFFRLETFGNINIPTNQYYP